MLHQGFISRANDYETNPNNRTDVQQADGHCGGRGRRNRKVKCICACGNETDVFVGNLVRGHTKSCGCVRRENESKIIHGHARSNAQSKEYSAWRHMKERCENPKATFYKHYGGRGITLCERWRVFENFLADMGQCPPDHSIERKDNNLGYSPDNCRWATQTEQCNNKRTNRIITFNGLSLTLMQWSRKTGINRGTINSRIVRDGWPLERALAP